MRIVIVVSLLLCCIACNNKKNTVQFVEREPVVEEYIKQKMFDVAYLYDSTAPYYVVVTIKNKNTGETKDVCTVAPFLRGALEWEHGTEFNMDSISTRYFELSNKKSLDNIGFSDYSIADLELYRESLDVDSLVKVLREKKHFEKYFEQEACARGEQEMFAHVMFDYGIMTRLGCETSSYCYTVLYDSTKVGIKPFEPDWNYY